MTKLKLVSILLLFLFSCAKEGKNIYIEGRVVNPVTGEGIPNVRLLLKKVVSNIDLTTESKVKQEVVSDADGNFVLKHNGTGNFVVSVEFIDDGYHFVGWKDESGQQTGDYKLYVTLGEVMIPRLELIPYSHFKVRLDNINCNGPSDTLLVYINSNYENITTQPFFQYGCGTIEGGFIKAHMGSYFINWTVIRNGVTEYFSDTMNLNKGEYRIFEIAY